MTFNDGGPNFDDDLWLDDAEIDALFVAVADHTIPVDPAQAQLAATLSSLRVALVDVQPPAPSAELAEFITVDDAVDGELDADVFPPLDAVDVEVELAQFDLDEMLRVLTDPTCDEARRLGRGAWWGSLAGAALACTLIAATFGVTRGVTDNNGVNGDRVPGISTVADLPDTGDGSLVPIPQLPDTSAPDGATAVDVTAVDAPAGEAVDAAPAVDPVADAGSDAAAIIDSAIVEAQAEIDAQLAQPPAGDAPAERAQTPAAPAAPVVPEAPSHAAESPTLSNDDGAWYPQEPVAEQAPAPAAAPISSEPPVVAAVVPTSPVAPVTAALAQAPAAPVELDPTQPNGPISEAPGAPIANPIDTSGNGDGIDDLIGGAPGTDTGQVSGSVGLGGGPGSDS